MDFEVAAGFAISLEVLTSWFIACIGEGFFDEIGGGGEVVVLPDVSFADLGGEDFHIAFEPVAEGDLVGGQGRKAAFITFSRYFEHN